MKASNPEKIHVETKGESYQNVFHGHMLIVIPIIYPHS